MVGILGGKNKNGYMLRKQQFDEANANLDKVFGPETNPYKKKKKVVAKKSVQPIFTGRYFDAASHWGF